MRLNEIFFDPKDAEPEHNAALKATGFWGKAAAGCVFLSRQTGRVGIAHRSDLPPPLDVEQPGTWGTIGGAINEHDDPMRATIREAEEEVGYHYKPRDQLVPWDIFQSGTFQYTTFIYVVDDEFATILNWEAQAFGWFEFGQWPQPLHFGLAATLNKPGCLNILKELIKEHRAT